MSSSQHRKYADNEENYRTLDKLISQAATLDDIIASLKAQQQQQEEEEEEMEEEKEETEEDKEEEEKEVKFPVKSPRKSERDHNEEGQVTCDLPRPICNYSQEQNGITAYSMEKEEVELFSLPSPVHPNPEVHTKEDMFKHSPSVPKLHNISNTQCDLLQGKVLSPKHSACLTPVRMELCLTKVKSPSKSGQLTPVRKRRMESFHCERLVKRLCQSDS